MKTLICTLALLIGFNSQAELIDNDIHLSNTITQDLHNLDNTGLTVRVAYPGLGISGVCAIDMIADSYRRDIPIQKLLEVVEISSLLGDASNAKVVSSTIIRIPLVLEAFVDLVTLSTKDGSSLKEAINKSLGENRRVVLMPRAC